MVTTHLFLGKDAGPGLLGWNLVEDGSKPGPHVLASPVVSSVFPASWQCCPPVLPGALSRFRPHLVSVAADLTCSQQPSHNQSRPLGTALDRTCPC